MNAVKNASESVGNRVGQIEERRGGLEERNSETLQGEERREPRFLKSIETL